MWNKREKAQLTEPSHAWIRDSSQDSTQKWQTGILGLTVENFQEFMNQVGCTVVPDLSHRLFRLMVYPADMDSESIMRRPCSRITFEQFVNGCKSALSCRNPGVRIRSIFNFYDSTRTGWIDKGQLYRGLVHSPSFQLQRDNDYPAPCQDRVLMLVGHIWVAFQKFTKSDPENTVAASTDSMSVKDFCRLAIQFPELTELFDLQL